MLYHERKKPPLLYGTTPFSACVKGYLYIYIIFKKKSFTRILKKPSGPHIHIIQIHRLGQFEMPLFHGTSTSTERVGIRYLLRRAARRRPISEELELIQNSMLVLSMFFSHIGNGGEYTVDNFIQSLPRVEISTLERDELECSICKLEYGTSRGNTSTVAALDPGLPGEEDAEKPVKLSCGHVFGDWCIKRWLLEQPPSCPICRFEFSSIALNYRLEKLGADE